MKRKLLALLLASTMALFSFTGCGKSQVVKDGEYEGKANGHNAELVVKVTVKDGEVSDVVVKEHQESEGISDMPIIEIPNLIVKNQSLNIDIIAGASVTSRAILDATESAIKEAGIDVESWKNKEVSKAEDSIIKEDVNCETVVVGAGGAGMKVALELTQRGQDVVIIDKMPFVGGATNLAATYFVAVDTVYQQEADMSISVEDYVNKQVESNPLINRENMIKMLEASQESVDWINSLGTKINRPMSNYQVATEDGSSLGVGIVKAMSEALENSNVDLRLETTALELISEDGVIKGIVVEDKEGSYNIFADNVVLATGGFASSDEAVKKYASDWAGLPSTSAASSTGDGVVMAESVGASLKYMDDVRLNPSVHTADGVSSSLSAARAEGGIMINSKGERFCNDYFPNYTQLSKWMIEQEGDIYIVIDQKSMDASKRLQGFKEKGYFFEAETVEELAGLINVPVENLVNTIEKYSQFAKNGVDEEFGRQSNMSTTFETAPYYAVLTTPGIQVTLGGVEVNENMQVIHENGAAFDNLYAVGEVAHDGLFGSAPTTINIFFGNVVAEHILGK